MLADESTGELQEEILGWKECTEEKGLKINISKIKGVVSGKNCHDVQRTRCSL